MSYLQGGYNPSKEDNGKGADCDGSTSFSPSSEKCFTDLDMGSDLMLVLWILIDYYVRLKHTTKK